jgi:triosephosphate isomerase
MQIQAAAISEELLSQCVVAYEPLDAIGSGNSQDPSIVEQVVAEIKNVFGTVRVLYGGSVTQQNIPDYLRVSDGSIVGTASLKAEEFVKLLRAAEAGEVAAN